MDDASPQRAPEGVSPNDALLTLCDPMLIAAYQDADSRPIPEPELLKRERAIRADEYRADARATWRRSWIGNGEGPGSAAFEQKRAKRIAEAAERQAREAMVAPARNALVADLYARLSDGRVIADGKAAGNAFALMTEIPGEGWRPGDITHWRSGAATINGQHIVALRLRAKAAPQGMRVVVVSSPFPLMLGGTPHAPGSWTDAPAAEADDLARRAFVIVLPGRFVEAPLDLADLEEPAAGGEPFAAYLKRAVFGHPVVTAAPSAADVAIAWPGFTGAEHGWLGEEPSRFRPFWPASDDRWFPQSTGWAYTTASLHRLATRHDAAACRQTGRDAQHNPAECVPTSLEEGARVLGTPAGHDANLWPWRWEKASRPERERRATEFRGRLMAALATRAVRAASHPLFTALAAGAWHATGIRRADPDQLRRPVPATLWEQGEGRFDGGFDRPSAEAGTWTRLHLFGRPVAALPASESPGPRVAALSAAPKTTAATRSPYATSDLRLMPELHDLVEGGLPTQTAARQLASKASGGGSYEAKMKRLAICYGFWKKTRKNE